MRKWTLCMLLIAALFAAQAHAASLPDFPAMRTAMGDDAWKQYRVPQLQVLKLEEGGALAACIDGDIIDAFTIEIDRITEGDTEDTDAENALARRILTALGCFQQDDIDSILAQAAGAPLTLSELTVLRLEGRSRWALCLCRREAFADMRFIAVHGGVRVHTNPRCSGMDTARMTTVAAANATGLQTCGLCGNED